MALKLLQPGCQPLGQFDGYDADYLTVKGGEVCTFGSVATPGQPGVTQSGFDKGAYDAFDGYVNPTSVGPNDQGPRRPVVTHSFGGTSVSSPIALQSVLSGGSTLRPLMLTDDGILGYGTLFGSVVGGVVGQQVNGPNTFTGAILGPATQTGSGKITCWEKPGLYAVSLDACDTSATAGLQPTNVTLDVGAGLSYTNSGLLTPSVGGNAAYTSGTPIVGRLIEFATNGSLVTTPNSLVAALNSPSGNVSSVGPRSFAFAVFYFNPSV
jgi:hypothetical protein